MSTLKSSLYTCTASFVGHQTDDFIFKKGTEGWHGAHQRDKGRLLVIASQLRWTSKSVEWYVGTSSSFRAVMARPMRHMLMDPAPSIGAADRLQSFLSEVKTVVFCFLSQLRSPKPHAVRMYVFCGPSLRSRDIHQEPPILASCLYVMLLKRLFATTRDTQGIPNSAVAVWMSDQLPTHMH